MVPIQEIIAAHPGLVQKLRRFSFAGASQFSASLSLLPNLHAQTIRIEILQHLIATCAEGNRIPERDDLADWAGKYLKRSPFAPHEDPVEDVFIGSINSPSGSFRVLMGILPDGDFWAERLLIFLSQKRDFPPFEAALAQVISLLKLSDKLTDRLGLPRYEAGGGARAEKISVPSWRDLQPAYNGLTFTAADLDAMGVDRSSLDDFILTNESRQNLAQENLWQSSLERRPLIEWQDGIMIIAPSSLGRCAIRFMVERITRGLGAWADTFFQIECASLFVNEVANSLDIHSLEFKEPTRTGDLPPLYPYFGYFDVGKPAILLSYCPALSETAKDWTGTDKLTDAEQVAVDAHLRACTAELEKMPGFSGGIVLVSCASLRGSIFGIPKWSRWRFHACSLPDWFRLTSGGQCTAMRLWKLAEHEAAVTRNNTEILNLAGLPNLFAAWKRNGFHILPRDRDARSLTMLKLECNFATDLRIEARRREDAHCLQSHDRQGWIKVIRYNAAHVFKDDEQIAMFISPGFLKERQLTGCIEDDSCLWWVVFKGGGIPAALRSVAFQLWECVFSWVARMAHVAMKEWPLFCEGNSVEIKLVLPNSTGWKIEDQPRWSVPVAALSVTPDISARRIILSLPEGFLNEFHTPKNVAERKIIEALLRSTATLAQTELNEVRCAELVGKIIPNDYARYFHFVRARSIEQLFAGSARPRPLFIADEDMAFSSIVAHLAGKNEEGNIVGLDACRDFLKEVVAKIWERIESKLAPFQRISVVSSCLHELDELARDEARWDMTTRSQFALRSNTEAVHDVLGERRSERDQASLCNRLIIETAQYACSKGEQLFTRADHLSLLADMALLLMLAHDRDVIAYGFIKPKVQILPNGEIEVDESFYSGAFGKYMTKRSRERTERIAESYKEFYSPDALATEAATGNRDREILIAQLDEIFIPEFGFSINLLLKLRDEFAGFAVHAGRPRGALDEAHMRAFLQNCGFSQAQSDSFLDRFTLPIRSAWNADLPPLCRKQDVYPWRFRRQLSLLMRPLPQIAVAPRAWIVSVPALAKSVHYIIGNIESAHFPEDFFRSKEMRSYIGNTVNKRGHAFAREVEGLISRSGYQTDTEVEMTKLGAPKKEALGDIDVLAWDIATGVVLVTECKRLMTAVTVREVMQRLEDFRGNREEKDSLGRHLRRLDWLTKYPEGLSRRTSIPISKMKLVPLLVTSETVPMQFFTEMKLSVSNVVPYSELEDYIRNKTKTG